MTLWTILIPTIPQREHLLKRLLDVLLPQLESHRGAVRVLAWRNAGTPTLGEIRDSLVRDAGSEYVSFVDDDDLVPDYYADEVMRALLEKPDHVGFKLDYTTNGVGQEIVDHSLRHQRWHRTKTGELVRDFTHIDPLRREIAMRGSFVTQRRHRAEDRHWVKQLRGHMSTEVYIDKVMYHYLWRADTTAWERPDLVTSTCAPLPIVDSPYFAWHPESV